MKSGDDREFWHEIGADVAFGGVVLVTILVQIMADKPRVDGLLALIFSGDTATEPLNC